MSRFCHLHCHSEYSLLDGMSRLEDMVLRAKALDQPAIALTDHGVMFGAIEFYRAAKKHGIKPIMGVEAYLAARRMEDRDPRLDKQRFHMLLLAENQTGYQNLLKLSSIAQLEGFYGRPRIDRETLAAHSEGLIATTGCLAAEVPRTLMNAGEEAALEKLKWYLDVFGRDRFFLELQPHDIPELHQVNGVLTQWARKHQIGLVATNDVHYVRQEDARPHDILLCIQTREVYSKTNRMRLSPHGSYYLTSHDEMLVAFRDYPEALRNTLVIAERCEVNLDTQGYHLPQFPAPAGYDAERYLRELVEAGVVERYGERRAREDGELRARVERELRVIHDLGFDNYFLIVWDLCHYAAGQDIWWNVRGSGAGSVVAYTLKITNIDPIRYDLLFDRFLNAARVSMPDIDIDFPDDRRHEMIEYAVNRYGTDKVAAIITFGTLGARAAVRDVARALEVPLSDADRIARMVPNVPGKPVQLKGLLFDEGVAEEWPAESAELRGAYQNEPTTRELLDTALMLEGQTRHASTHAAGIVISDKPIIEYAPLHRPTKGDESGPIQKVVQFDMNIVESIGLLKVDFLGLATLSIMRRACEHIERRRGRKLDLNTIPYERCPQEPERDADIVAAYKVMQAGHTVGIFQLEGAGMRRVIQEMQPDQFEHIIAAISLYRPGPMEYIPSYIRRMHGKEEIAYHHKTLEDILGNTFGICVSGDALVVDARTGARHRLADVGALEEFAVQGINERWEPAVGRVTHWIDSGVKPVYEVTLRNGSSIKVTSDHRLLTERGWMPLYDLQPGDYIGTPHNLIVAAPSTYDRRRLRVLAYLIADGSISTGTVVDFVSKDQGMVEEYIRSLDAFDTLSISTLQQVREVTRVSVAKAGGAYHDANTLLAWMRSLGLQYPAGSKPGGARSSHKFVPDFVFSLCEEEIAFFLASLWDCDGYMGQDLCHYRTISRRLAEDVQTLLLRLGFQSTIYESSHTLPHDDTECHRTAHQVTVYDTERLAALLQPHMASASQQKVRGTGHFEPTIQRDDSITELDQTVTLSRRALPEQYGIDHPHLVRGNVFRRPRPSTRSAAAVVDQLPLPETARRLNVVWQEIVSIEPAGEEAVYDLTVEGLHSFVANNVIVHNCVYQEQIMRMATDIAGYSPAEADLMRRAVSKKKAKDIEYHKSIFVEGATKRGIPQETAEKIYGDIEYFARYGFNKCLPGDVEVVDGATGRLVTIEALYEGSASLGETVTCDTDTLRLRRGAVSDVLFNGVKPVFRLTTDSGRTIEATGNHPFYTFDGWRLLETLREGELIATPRRIPVEGTREWPEHEVIALGHLLAEGNLCHPHSVYFYSQAPEEVADYVRAAEQFPNVACSVAMHKGTHSVYARRVARDQEPGIVSWARRLGIWGKDAHTKEIPAEAFELTSAQLGLLISRLWAGDGHINVEGRSLYYASASHRMATQLQHLLLRLGILSHLRTVTFPYKEGRIGYQLFVTGNGNLTRFAEAVGPHIVSEARRSALAQLVLPEPRPPEVKDIVPLGIKQHVREAKARTGMTWKGLRAASGVAQREFYPTSAPSKIGFSRGTIGRLATLFEDDELRRYAESDIYWDRIASIEYVGEKPTYDLTVPGTHNFVANDILVHNSHAADYAVITVQTAYLKAHYPVEYLCALLEIEFDDTEKVPVFLNECRRLGINVLAPDINCSGARFTIEEDPDPERATLPESDYRRWAIRVGMGAIKNVGLGAVELILNEREANGPFASLDEFCTRVDMRQINRRVLECLARVGLFDDLARAAAPTAPRETVVAILDRMMKTSEQHHAAADVGQMTMFDLLAGPQAGGTVRHSVLHPLPTLTDLDPRRRLDDEKELLGIYLSDHPLQQVAAEVGRSITCFCGELNHDQVGQSVVIAGLITNVRLITTKKGDRMAFVRLEDLQGESEVVIFPRTYEQSRELLVNDTILLVRGKVEARTDRLSVLADVIQTYEPSAPITVALASAHEEPAPPPFEGMPMEMPPLPSEAESSAPSLLDSVQHHITLTLERGEDPGADVVRLQRVIHALEQYQGEDRVTLRLSQDDRIAQLSFPNLRTSWNAQLRDHLLGQGVSFDLRDVTPDPRARYRRS